MNSLVIDCSTTVGFVLPDEQDVISLKALDAIEKKTPTYVPAHWCFEVTNALLTAERRSRASQSNIADFLNQIQALPVIVDEETARQATKTTYTLARQFGLTIYDAAYLELALRRRATLATNDRDLLKAAKAAGVMVL